MELSQSFNTHFKTLGYTLILLLLSFIGWVYFRFDDDYLSVMGVFLAALVLPSLYLHVEYTLINWGQSMWMTNEVVIVKSKGEESTFLIREFEKAIIVRAATIDDGFPLYPIHNYHYIRLIANDNRELIITCLMTTEIKEVERRLKSIPMWRVKKSFCSI